MYYSALSGILIKYVGSLNMIKISRMYTTSV